MAISSVGDISGLIMDLDPHVEAYQDAAGTTAAGSGDPVGNLPDQVGSYDFSQSTSGNQPVLATDSNGWLYVNADGSDDILQHSAGLSLSTASIVMVFQPEPGAVNVFQSWFTGNNYAATNGLTLAWRDTSYEARTYSADTNDSESCSVSARHVVYGIFDGSLLTTYSDNTGTGTAATGSVAPTSPMSIFDRPAGSRAAKGRLYRLLIWNKALDSTERSDLYSYLNTLYSSAPPSGGSGSPWYYNLQQAIAAG